MMMMLVSGIVVKCTQILHLFIRDSCYVISILQEWSWTTLNIAGETSWKLVNKCLYYCRFFFNKLILASRKVVTEYVLLITWRPSQSARTEKKETEGYDDAICSTRGMTFRHDADQIVWNITKRRFSYPSKGGGNIISSEWLVTYWRGGPRRSIFIISISIFFLNLKAHARGVMRSFFVKILTDAG